MTLTDVAILALERRFYAVPGSKATAIVTELGMTPTRYYQRLNAILDDPEALALDAQTVRRLRRLRDARKASRSA